MKILILHQSPYKKIRKTILDHLYCFKRYAQESNIHYCNLFLGLPSFLSYAQYDAIILHYSLLGARCSAVLWQKLMQSLINLKDFKGMKIAIPQDEMYFSDSLCDLFRQIGVYTVYTCADPIDYQTLYPQEKTHLKHYFTTLTGFVDEETLQTIENLKKEIPHRDIDLGYRGNRLPYHIGKHGQLKRIIAEKFIESIKNQPLNTDISINPHDVFFGEDWLRFLLRCRTSLGCLGGSGLHDPKGTIRKTVEAYLRDHPQASFEEVEEHCFKGLDGRLHLFALSPRHFENAMTKTCQVLLEGDYRIFQPDTDYIEVKKDFRNIGEVLEKIKNKNYCEKIAENAYEHIVLSQKYTYRAFAQEVFGHIKAHKKALPPSKFCFAAVGLLLNLRKSFEPFLALRLHIWKIWNIVLQGSTWKKIQYILKTALPKQIVKIKLKVLKNGGSYDGKTKSKRVLSR